MTKQEEIRDGLTRIINEGKVNRVTAGVTAKKAIRFLVDEGVVIKTGDEWCIEHGYPLPCDKCGATHGQSAVEPLI